MPALGRLWHALLPTLACLVAACGSQRVEPTRPNHKLLTVPTDAQGTAIVAKAETAPIAPFVSAQLQSYGRQSSLEAWRTRIDVGGDTSLRAFVTAPEAALLRMHPDVSIRIDPTRFGTDYAGICLGEDELAFSSEQSYLDIQHCRADNLTLWLPIAQGAWVAIGDRAVVRADVVDYVHQLFTAAPAAAARSGRAPLRPPALRPNRVRFHAFLAAAHAR
ncbi:MAG: hypothetical protein H7287_00090, partial [Thermoleophilia bacterium]|nr:hypothetical protein [Thermoleophilia bacterium]